MLGNSCLHFFLDAASLFPLNSKSKYSFKISFERLDIARYVHLYHLITSFICIFLLISWAYFHKHSSYLDFLAFKLLLLFFCLFSNWPVFFLMNYRSSLHRWEITPCLLHNLQIIFVNLLLVFWPCLWYLPCTSFVTLRKLLNIHIYNISHL